MHGEGVDDDLDFVAIVGRKLPHLLAEIPLENIYNFDVTCDYPIVVMMMIIVVVLLALAYSCFS